MAQHHYIPQFYLAGFTDTGTRDGRLWVIDQKQAKQFSSSPYKVAKQRDFYRVEAPDVDPDAIEKAFMKLEDQAAVIVRRAEEQLSLPEGKDYEILINFIALLAIRVPAIRRALSDGVDQLMRMILKMALATPEQWKATVEAARADGVDLRDDVPYEKLREFVFGDRYKVKVSRNFYVSSVIQAMDFILEPLAARNWVVVTPAHDAGEFIASDRPVSLVWTRKVPAFWGPGFATRDTQVTVPLTKRIGLVGVFEPRRVSVMKLDRTRVASFNSRTGMYAERFIYAPSPEVIWLTEDGRVAGTQELLNVLVSGKGG